MNQRILELAQQAGWDISEIMKMQNAQKMSKFAQLIVAECARAVNLIEGDGMERTVALADAEAAVKNVFKD